MTFHLIVYTNKRRGLAVVQAGECDVIDYDVAYDHRFDNTPEGCEEAKEKAVYLAEKHSLRTSEGKRYLE